MTFSGLLEIAEEALNFPAPADIPAKYLELVMRSSGASAGELLCRGQSVAGRGETENSTSGEAEQVWTVENGEWSLRLEGGSRPEGEYLTGLRLVLKALSLHDELRRARFDTRYHLWELEIIRSIASNIKHLDDPEKLASELLAHLMALLGVRRAQIYLGDGDTPVAGIGDTILLPEEREKMGPGVLLDNTRMATLLGSTEKLGVLAVAEKEARSGIEAFAEEDRRLVELFALQMTLALEYAAFARKSLERDRLERELQVAATIQRHILPQHPPSLRHFEIITRSTPCLHVAGDTYDTIECGGDLVLAITDVSGKGVGAGLIASGIHAGIRLLLGEDLYLADLAGRLNSYLCEATDSNRFATFAMVRITGDGFVYAVNAGHCPILIRRNGGEVEEIGSSGLPLGIMERGAYRTEECRLENGDLVLLYTDGFTEAEDPEGNEFGVPRVIETLKHVSGGAKEAADALFEAIHSFAEGRPLNDDATLVAVEYRV